MSGLVNSIMGSKNKKPPNPVPTTQQSRPTQVNFTGQALNNEGKPQRSMMIVQEIDSPDNSSPQIHIEDNNIAKKKNLELRYLEQENT